MTKMGTGKKVTTAKAGTGHKISTNVGTIRRPKARTGTGFTGARKGAVRTWGNKLGTGGVSAKKLRKGSIRSQNRYK